MLCLQYRFVDFGAGKYQVGNGCAENAQARAGPLGHRTGLEPQLDICDVSCRVLRRARAQVAREAAEKERKRLGGNAVHSTPSNPTTPCKVTPVILHGVVSPERLYTVMRKPQAGGRRPAQGREGARRAGEIPPLLISLSSSVLFVLSGYNKPYVLSGYKKPYTNAQFPCEQAEADECLEFIWSYGGHSGHEPHCWQKLMILVQPRQPLQILT